jgi:CubicO group peptidase (beta-lactamase class C family)/D-alanyl-D-alanine dipeptidase
LSAGFSQYVHGDPFSVFNLKPTAAHYTVNQPVGGGETAWKKRRPSRAVPALWRETMGIGGSVFATLPSLYTNEVFIPSTLTKHLDDRLSNCLRGCMMKSESGEICDPALVREDALEDSIVPPFHWRKSFVSLSRRVATLGGTLLILSAVLSTSLLAAEPPSGENASPRAAGAVAVPDADTDADSPSGEQREEESSPQAADHAAVIEALSAVIRDEVEQKQIPAFSFALVEGDRLVWAEGFGFRDAEKTQPATADTIYRVGSISKLFTALAIMQMAEAGKLDIDAPLQDYLPEFHVENPHDIPLTLRQMMSHQSGLVRESPVGNYFDPTEPTLEETIASLQTTSLVYAPQTRTKYSNAAIAVVGGALEKVAGQSHPEFVQSRLLDPLDMTHSSFVLTPDVRARLATGWMWTYDGQRFEAPQFLLGTGPAGNMYSSVRDLAKFVSCLLDDCRADGSPLLQPETYRQMITPSETSDGAPQSFGLGFHIRDLDGMTQIGHGGAVYGFSTQLEVLPERKLGVVAASALDGSNGIAGRLAEHALRLMMASQDNQPLPQWRRTEAIDPDRARQLVGEYQEEGGERTAEISEFDGALYLRQGTFRHELRTTVDDGTIVTDDVIGHGTKVQREGSDRVQIGSTAWLRLPDEPPPEPPSHWKGLIGEYGWDHNTLYILEDRGKLVALIEWFYYYPLREIDEDLYEFPDYGLYHGEGLQFRRNESGEATEVVAAEVKFERREVGTKDGETFRITPIRPIEELREGARSATPPRESGSFLPSDLVEPSELDPGIRLDIRYASTNNFTGEVFYDQPRAFLQRPAAEAVVRVHRSLAESGVGLLIHDAYRPWYVTKMFWDATPDELKRFVANPALGSRHNRGCAVDLTLYDLESGEPIQMVAGYDEFSSRSYPTYPGGTSRGRWYRGLLRRAMEQESFRVYEYEWWHFDYQDWQRYRIGNETFEELVGEASR